MVYLKTDEEIELIKLSGVVLGKAHAEVAKLLRPGIKTLQLDKCAEEYIRDNGGIPSFKGYNRFPGSLCISIGAQVVHGIPGNYELMEGDIVSIDCGVFLNGFHSDSAYTYSIGQVSDKVNALLRATKESLYIGIERAEAGARLGDVGFAIQQYVEARGFTVVRELVGHGVGRNLHEAPEVPNFGKRGQGTMLKPGMVIAIEPMINLGKRNVLQEKDGWTIRTTDRLPSAHFEHTVAIRKGKAEVLTTFEYIEQVLNSQKVAISVD
ncbi:MAG: type I methionyl aminopeptidase [Bacteroidota bacterium]